MARSKPYTKKLAVLDAVCILLSYGGWLIVMLVRELYRHNGPTTE